jgi:hypothetical protein
VKTAGTRQSYGKMMRGERETMREKRGGREAEGRERLGAGPYPQDFDEGGRRFRQWCTGAVDAPIFRSLAYSTGKKLSSKVGEGGGWVPSMPIFRGLTYRKGEKWSSPTWTRPWLGVSEEKGEFWESAWPNFRWSMTLRMGKQKIMGKKKRKSQVMIQTNREINQVTRGVTCELWSM